MGFALEKMSEGAVIVSVGYDGTLKVKEKVEEISSMLLEKSGSVEEIELWGYSFGAKVLTLALEKLRTCPEVMGKISVKLICPYFGSSTLKPEQKPMLQFGALAPKFLGSVIDFFGKRSERAITEAVRKDFESLEDPAYDFTTYSEVCGKIYKERNFSKIIAECKAMVGELSPLRIQIPVHAFITKRDEFMDWSKQVGETKRVFGESAKIQFVDSTHCGFPFEKSWTSAIQHIS